MVHQQVPHQWLISALGRLPVLGLRCRDCGSYLEFDMPGRVVRCSYLWQPHRNHDATMVLLDILRDLAKHDTLPWPAKKALAAELGRPWHTLDFGAAMAAFANVLQALLLTTYSFADAFQSTPKAQPIENDTNHEEQRRNNEQ